jgi:hypothetical protein
MSNAIKSMFASGGKPYLVTDSGLQPFTNNGLEPRDWPGEIIRPDRLFSG